MAKITINKEGLYKILSALSSGFPGKELIGTDGLFKIEISNNVCTVYVINSKVQMKSQIACQHDMDNIVMCIHNRVITEMVRNFPDGDMVITTEGEADNVKAINLKPEGQRKKYRIACTVSRDFPNYIDEIHEQEVLAEFEMPATQFSNLMKTMAANTDPNNTVPSFANIVWYSLEGKLTFISGGSNLISIIQTEVDFSSQSIVPREIFKYTSHLTGIDKCHFTLTGGRLFLVYSGFEMSLSLIDGKISNYKALIDVEPSNNKFVFTKKDFIESLSRLSIFTDSTERIIMNVTGDDCEMTATNIDFGNEGSEVLTITNEDQYTDKFGLKYSFMQKICSNIPTDNIEVKRGDRIAFFRAESRKDILWLVGLANI